MNYLLLLPHDILQVIYAFVHQLPKLTRELIKPTKPGLFYSKSNFIVHPTTRPQRKWAAPVICYVDNNIPTKPQRYSTICTLCSAITFKIIIAPVCITCPLKINRFIVLNDSLNLPPCQLGLDVTIKRRQRHTMSFMPMCSPAQMKKIRRGIQ